MASTRAPHVLVVHGDASLRARIAAILSARGHAVSAAPAADHGVGQPAVMVVDHLALPTSTCARVLALVPHPDETAILAAFAAGADDVLAGPLRIAELSSRVSVLARRAVGVEQLRVGPIALDTAARRVTLADRPLVLTRHEYELLAQLARAPGRVFTKQELLRDIWAGSAAASTRRLDTQVARLRRRLGDHRTLLVTVWGVGYRLGG